MVKIYSQFRQASFVLDNLLSQYDQEKEKRDNLFETSSSTMDQFGSSCCNITHNQYIISVYTLNLHRLRCVIFCVMILEQPHSN